MVVLAEGYRCTCAGLFPTPTVPLAVSLVVAIALAISSTIPLASLLALGAAGFRRDSGGGDAVLLTFDHLSRSQFAGLDTGILHNLSPALARRAHGEELIRRLAGLVGKQVCLCDLAEAIALAVPAHHLVIAHAEGVGQARCDGMLVGAATRHCRCSRGSRRLGWLHRRRGSRFHCGFSRRFFSSDHNNCDDFGDKLLIVVIHRSND